MDANALTELYDSEIASIGPVWEKLMHEFSRKASSRRNLDELERRARDEFMKIGLVVEVDTTGCLIAQVNPKDGSITYGSPQIVIQGRIPGSKRSNTMEGWEVLDHERKRDEVLRAKDLGELYHGQKSPNRV